MWRVERFSKKNKRGSTFIREEKVQIKEFWNQWISFECSFEYRDKLLTLEKFENSSKILLAVFHFNSNSSETF